jgi:hypothetical protein
VLNCNVSVFFSQIDVKKSVPQESKPKARKIFVGGLAPETREGMFRTCMHRRNMRIAKYPCFASTDICGE